MNHAKDQVIHHLSHELKTPVSVVAASLSLLEKRLSATEAQGYQRVLERAQRNLQRILDMQYEIESYSARQRIRHPHLLSMLLDACVDELEVLVADEFGEWNVMRQIRRRIEPVRTARRHFPENPLSAIRAKTSRCPATAFCSQNAQITFSGETTSPGADSTGCAL